MKKEIILSLPLEDTKSNNHVDMADVCELCHILTMRECRRLHEVVDSVNDEETRYTKKAQKIFDFYFDLVTHTLNV